MREQQRQERDFNEQETLLLKQHFKDQLLHFGESVRQLQGTLEEREREGKTVKDINLDLRGQIDALKDKVVLAENQK